MGNQNRSNSQQYYSGQRHKFIGVPSWMLVLIKQILEKTGKQTLEEVWPNLEVFFHGGVAFTPYREQYKQVIHSPKMHYVETYNASEGYFGTQNIFQILQCC